MAIEPLLIKLATQGGRTATSQIDSVTKALQRQVLILAARQKQLARATIEAAIPRAAVRGPGGRFAQDPRRKMAIAEVKRLTSSLQRQQQTVALTNEKLNILNRVLGRAAKAERRLAQQTARVRRRMDRFRKTARSASNALRLLRTTVFNLFALMGTAFMIRRLAENTIAFAKLGGTVLVTRQQFVNAAAAMSTTAEKLLPALQKATAKTVSNFELMKAANFAINAGLKLSQEGFVKLGEAAFKLGLITGRDTTEGIRRLGFGVVKLERRILDELGIVVRASDVFKKFAAAHGLVASALTAEQKQAAFLDVVLEEVTRKLGEFKGVNFEAAAAGSQAAAAIDDFRAEMAELFLESGAAQIILKGVTDIIAELRAEFSDTEAMKGFANIILGFLRGAINLARALLTLMKSLGPIIAGVANSLASLVEALGPTLTTALLGAFIGTRIAAPFGAVAAGIGAGVGFFGGLFAGAAGGGGTGVTAAAVAEGTGAPLAVLSQRIKEDERFIRRSGLDDIGSAGLGLTA